MDKDIIALVRLIVKRSFTTLYDVEKETDATKRQITYRLDKLNQLIEDNGFQAIILGSQKEFLIEEATRDFLVQFLFDSHEDIEYYLDRDERKIYLYLWMFIDREYLSLQHFMSMLQVSKSTVIQDLSELTDELKDEHITLAYDRLHGYYLDGAEMGIRRYMMRLVISSISEHQNTHVLDRFIDEQHLNTFDFSKLIIQELADKYDIVFVEDRLVEFIYILILLNTRIVDGKNVNKDAYDLPNIDMISTFKEYEFTTALIDFFPYRDKINDQDRKYISSWILGISVGNVEDKNEDCLIIGQIVGKIMTRFELLSGIRYRDSEQIFRHIFSHFRPAYYRLLFKLPIVNPLKNRVKEEYPALYSLVKETMKPFWEIFEEEIGDDELAYLTMHFATIYTENKKEQVLKRKKALIICLNGIGSSVILYNELKSLFPEIEFLLPIELSQFNPEEYDVDIIFTTKIFKELVGIPLPIVKVSPIMDANERYTVFREVVTHLGNYGTLTPRAEEITAILEKHLGSIPNEKQLVAELMNYYLRVPQEQLTKIERGSLRLIDMMTETMIELNVEASSADEALRISGGILVNQGFVHQSYVDAVIKSHHMRPSYYVIAPQIAFPHTTPDHGVVKPGISLVTLQKPLFFGNKENDPVKYIFFLAAVDNQRHIQAMGELLELMNNSDFLQLLDRSNNPSEVIQFIQQAKTNQ